MPYLPFLAKPLRNLLLATMLGIATFVVETERVHAQPTTCDVVMLGCLNQGGIPIHEMGGGECQDNVLVYAYVCMNIEYLLIIDAGYCTGMNPSTGFPEYCGGGSCPPDAQYCNAG